LPLYHTYGDLESDVEITELCIFITKFADDSKGLQDIQSEGRDKMEKAINLPVESADT
jgi:hypothetical protein